MRLSPPVDADREEKMNILFNSDKLLRLVTNLQSFTGISTSIYDADGKGLLLGGDHCEFCRLMNGCPEGHARCVASDAQAVRRCSVMRTSYGYRCHAGVNEMVLPIYDSGLPVAYLAFGQVLDSTPPQQQWEAAARGLSWYKGDMEELKKAFLNIRQLSGREMNAYAEILEALALYIRQEGIIRSAEYTDLQKLELYLDQHYMEPLSLGRISADLHVGTTKLCALAKKLSGGSTLTRIIAQRRVNAAKDMLLKSDAPVAVVAEKVGFSDYNYFTKIFKSITGITPSAYRRENRVTQTVEGRPA